MGDGVDEGARETKEGERSGVLTLLGDYLELRRVRKEGGKGGREGRWES